MSLPRDPFNLIVCVVGGQGNILIARLIGRIMVKQGYHLAIGETFGAAQRGGSVFSSLRISKKKALRPLDPQIQRRPYLEPGAFGNPAHADTISEMNKS